MVLYEHWQDVKNAKPLPDPSKVGACLTCKFWEAEAPRHVTGVPKLARCMQPDLIPLALVVSGSSACNKWAKHPNVGQEAQDYSLRGEPE